MWKWQIFTCRTWTWLPGHLKLLNEIHSVYDVILSFWWLLCKLLNDLIVLGRLKSNDVLMRCLVHGVSVCLYLCVCVSVKRDLKIHIIKHLHNRLWSQSAILIPPNGLSSNAYCVSASYITAISGHCSESSLSLLARYPSPATLAWEFQISGQLPFQSPVTIWQQLKVALILRVNIQRSEYC